MKATAGPGHWTVVTATIPGSDASVSGSSAAEIIYSCHLDHERPGANDNGSGCVTILESARVLARLIATGALPRPKRTLRFIWGPEVEGTMAFLASHPEIRQRARANIHMDMVGGDFFKNKSVFHLTGTPWSLPSFVTDVGAAFWTRFAPPLADLPRENCHPTPELQKTALDKTGPVTNWLPTSRRTQAAAITMITILRPSPFRPSTSRLARHLHSHGPRQPRSDRRHEITTHCFAGGSFRLHLREPRRPATSKSDFHS